LQLAGAEGLQGGALHCVPEIRALARFDNEAGLMLETVAVRQLLGDALFVGQGPEHRVVAPHGSACVLKDYDPRMFDLETFEVFYKPAEHLFDYLTDHLLANHFFGDDIRLYGFHLADSPLRVLLSQPFIAGRHPNWEEMVARLEDQGLMHERQGSQNSRFWVDGGEAGRILVTDVHEDNVIVSSVGVAHPIDVHFSFRSRETRLQALQKNTTRWARQRMVEDGRMKSSSPSGIWEISDAGRLWLGKER
jgi:hypothetical protein